MKKRSQGQKYHGQERRERIQAGETQKGLTREERLELLQNYLKYRKNLETSEIIIKVTPVWSYLEREKLPTCDYGNTFREEMEKIIDLSDDKNEIASLKQDIKKSEIFDRIISNIQTFDVVEILTFSKIETNPKITIFTLLKKSKRNFKTETAICKRYKRDISNLSPLFNDLDLLPIRIQIQLAVYIENKQGWQFLTIAPESAHDQLEITKKAIRSFYNHEKLKKDFFENN